MKNMCLLDACIFRNLRTKCECDLCSLCFKNNYLSDKKEKCFIVMSCSFIFHYHVEAIGDRKYNNLDLSIAFVWISINKVNIFLVLLFVVSSH